MLRFGMVMYVLDIYLEPDFLAKQSLIWPVGFVEAGDEGTNTSC